MFILDLLYSTDLRQGVQAAGSTGSMAPGCQPSTWFTAGRVRDPGHWVCGDPAALGVGGERPGFLSWADAPVLRLVLLSKPDGTHGWQERCEDRDRADMVGRQHPEQGTRKEDDS